MLATGFRTELNRVVIFAKANDQCCVEKRLRFSAFQGSEDSLVDEPVEPDGVTPSTKR